jgi:chromosome segregation ATPase
MEAPQNETSPPVRTTPAVPKMPVAEPLISDNVKTVLIFLLIIAVGYLLYDNFQYQGRTQTELTRLKGGLEALENKSKAAEAKISTVKGELQDAVGSTKAEIKKTAQQFQVQGQKTKEEFTQALSTKADASQVQKQVQAAKQEADAKIGQVSSEVGGVKTEVGTVKTDLATTKRDLEGTQRQLVDVRENLTAAVAKNASELAQLRLKGERDYYEFEIPKRNQVTKIEDIRIILTKTDPKKGKYSLSVLVDDNKLEKKDRALNEPIQFLVGRNRIRYEMVINWVQKEKAGGYLSIPKDKALSAERPAPK